VEFESNVTNDTTTDGLGTSGQENGADMKEAIA